MIHPKSTLTSDVFPTALLWAGEAVPAPRLARMPAPPLWAASRPLKLMFYQHGCLRDALDRFAAGGAETYRDQRRSVTYVEELAKHHDVTVVAMCGTPYDEQRGNLRMIGLTDQASFDRPMARALLADIAPDRLIARSPHKPLLRAAAKARIPTLPCLADTFSRGGGLRKFIRLRRLQSLLQGSHIPCVANHSLNASRAMVSEMWLRAARVVPWDWSRLPVSDQIKTAPGTPFRMLYAGGLRERKGVGDVMAAMARLQGQGVDCTLSIAGRGEGAPWRARAEALGIEVRFLGLLANDVLRAEMARHDAVLVPSRHDYPEGLPNTIYEGLAERTPVILSDHPSFVGRLQPETEAVFFEGGNPDALAEAIARLARNPVLYARISRNSAAALDQLYCGMEWEDLMTHFIADPANRTGWVAAHSLRGLGHAGPVRTRSARQCVPA